MENLASDTIESFEVDFCSIKSDPVKFIQIYFDELSKKLVQEKANLNAKIDNHFENLMQSLKKFQQECESAALNRNFAFYDTLNESYQEKLVNLKETLLLYKTVELNVAYDEDLLNNLANLQVYNKYKNEEEELKKWLESKEWRPFNITEYDDIIGDVDETDKDWLTSMQDFFIKEGVSEKTVDVLIRNSCERNWPNGLRNKQLRQANVDKIKELIYCKLLELVYNFKAFL